jgi:hypothetical protein
MAKGKHLDKKAVLSLLEKITAEIALHRENPDFEMTNNEELGRQFGILRWSVNRYCKNLMPEKDKVYRENILEKQGAKKGGKLGGRKYVQLYGPPTSGMSKEQLSTQGKRNYLLGLAKLTSEQHSTNAKKGNKKRIGCGIGLMALSEEQRRKNGQAGARKRNAFYGLPSYNFSLEQRRKNGVKAAGAVRKSRYSFNGNHFDSQSETACAAMLEKYLPNWKVEEGKTFQVNHEIPKTIDFLVGDTFLEWHPILMFKGKNNLGDMPSTKQYHKFKEMKAEMSPERAKVFERRYKRVLAGAYLEERVNAVRESDSYRGYDVVLAQTPEEVYDFIAQRAVNLPNRDEFVREFSSVKKEVARANKEKVDEKKVEVA